MYILDYFKANNPTPTEFCTSEYRLLCSGTIYRGDKGVGDLNKSIIARILIDKPFSLYRVRELTDYPSELAIEIVVPQSHEGSADGQSSFIFYPDDEVANDIAALLTVLCRRLISVYAKVSQRSISPHPLYHDRAVPVSIQETLRLVAWRPHPLIIKHWPAGSEIVNYNPPPLEIDSQWLHKALTGLPSLNCSKSLVSSCRLYAKAMELIHDRPEMAYQLLISSVETMAGCALSGYEPNDDEKVESRKHLYDFALTNGISATLARDLVVRSCKGDHWVGKKFKKFLTENLAESFWTKDDDLFRTLPATAVPSREQLQSILGKIYDARSKATHAGAPFPHLASFTGGPTIDARAAAEMFSGRIFPPVVWFERLVQSSLVGFWERAVEQHEAIRANINAISQPLDLH